MKTKNLILIVLLVAFATMNYSSIADEAPRFTVKISLKVALQDPYLVRAMHEQLTPAFLHGNGGPAYYTVTVKFRHGRYIITGSYSEWKKFFELALEGPTPGS
jgi:hypothetical protein